MMRNRTWPHLSRKERTEIEEYVLRQKTVDPDITFEIMRYEIYYRYGHKMNCHRYGKIIRQLKKESNFEFMLL